MSLRILLAALLLFVSSVHAELTVRVLEVDPPLPATLAAGQALNLRLAYSGAARASLWAHPYYRGKRVERAINNASRKYDGEGTALVWFALDAADPVDEVRIVAGGGQPYRQEVVLSHPVQVNGTGVRSGTRERAPWVEEELRVNETAAKREREAARGAANEPGTAFANALFIAAFVGGVITCLVGGLLWPAWAAWRWSGAWRIAAMMPLAWMAFVVGRIVFDVATDSSSHNLWPFEILLSGGACLAVMAAIAIARRFQRARSPS